MGIVIGLRFVEIDCEHVSLEYDRARFNDSYFYCADKTGAVTLLDCCKCKNVRNIRFYRPNDSVSDDEYMGCPAIIDEG